MEDLTRVLTATLMEMKELACRSQAATSTIEIPKFHPVSTTQGAQKWCEEIEKLGKTFHWTDYEQVSRAASGLHGEAKDWYFKWQPEERTWENLKNELSSLYPAKRNLSEKLRQISLFTSRCAATYCEYARKKVTLINSLNFDLTTAQLLELVIGDIDDVHVKTAAFNCNVDSVSGLLMLLSNYEISKPGGSNKNFKRPYPFEQKKEAQQCFVCQKSDHLARSCPERGANKSHNNKSKVIEKVTCSFCHKSGHSIERCFKKINKRS